MPKAVVRIAGELSLASQTLKRFHLPHCCVPLNVVEHGGRQHEEAPIYPAFLRFFAHANNPRSIRDQGSKTPRWPHRRYSAQEFLLAMKSKERAYVNVRDAISISHKEFLIFREICTYPLQAAAGHGL